MPYVTIFVALVKLSDYCTWRLQQLVETCFHEIDPLTHSIKAPNYVTLIDNLW